MKRYQVYALYDKRNGEIGYIEVFSCIAHAIQKYHVKHIFDVLRGRHKTAGGYHWEYVSKEG